MFKLYTYVPITTNLQVLQLYIRLTDFLFIFRFTDELDSESNSAPLTPTVPTAHMTIEHLIHTDSDGCNTPPEPRKTWSREEFLHETAATGGPNLGMRIR